MREREYSYHSSPRRYIFAPTNEIIEISRKITFSLDHFKVHSFNKIKVVHIGSYPAYGAMLLFRSRGGHVSEKYLCTK